MNGLTVSEASDKANHFRNQVPILPHEPHLQSFCPRNTQSRPWLRVVQSALMRIQLRQRNIDAITVPTVKTAPFALSP